MKANLDLKIWGIRGNAPSWNPNKAQCVMHIDSSFLPANNSSYISADAFTGLGESYKRAEQTTIEIVRHEKTIFNGSFAELSEKLSPKPLYFLFGDDACRIYSEDGIEALTEYIESGEGYATYEFTGNAIDLISNYTGWGDYVILQKDEYDQISEL